MRHNTTNGTSFTRYFTYVLVLVTLLSAFYSSLYILRMESEPKRGSKEEWEKQTQTDHIELKTSEFQKIPKKRMAWASLAMKDYDVKGVIALAQSLKWANTTYPFVVIASKTISEKMIHLLKIPNLGIEHIRFIDPIQIPSHVRMGWPHWQLALNKLEMWNLVQYEKLVYIDADFIALRNMDDFFDYPELTASTNLGVGCTLLEKADSNQGGVNAGLVVLQPSEKKYQDMIKMFNNGTNWHNSDQGIIEAFFSSTTQLFPINWVTFSWCCTAPWFDRSALRAVHFTRGTINYDKLAQQDIMANWDKNWPGKPNCDYDFYHHWKKMWHMAIDEP